MVLEHGEHRVVRGVGRGIRVSDHGSGALGRRQRRRGHGADLRNRSWRYDPRASRTAGSFRPYWIYFSSLTVSAVQFHRRTGITFLRSGLLAWKLPDTDRA